MNTNLELWHKVEKTNPKYTKQANVGGNKITSIAPQFQIMNVTEQFGSYGKTWGFKNIQLDYTLASEFKMNFNGEPYFDVGVSSWVCEVCGMEFFKYEDILYSRLQYDSGRYKVPVAGRKPYWF